MQMEQPQLEAEEALHAKTMKTLYKYDQLYFRQKLQKKKYAQ